MKKLFVFAMAAMALTIFNGCQKESEELMQKKELVAFDSDYEFALNNLTKIGFNLLLDSKNANLRNKIYELAALQFDQDFDVLLKDLKFNSAFSDLKSASNINLLNCFKEIDGNNYYPQVFIPFYDELEKKKILGKNSPVMIIFAGGDDDKKSEFPGYICNDNDEIEKLDFLVTEDFARKNEVWVISINERVDDTGEVITDFIAKNNQSSLKSAMSAINCRIDKMKVTRHFESWAAGKSEVSIWAYLEYWDGLNSNGQPVDVSSDRTTGDYTGILIRQFTRDDIDYQRTFELNWNLQSSWTNTDFYSDPIIYLYVIFESDSWPTGTNTESTPLADGTIRYMTFRSADESYSIGTIYSNTNNGQFQSKYAGSYTVYNSNIQFNTELY